VRVRVCARVYVRACMCVVCKHIILPLAQARALVAPCPMRSPVPLVLRSIHRSKPAGGDHDDSSE